MHASGDAIAFLGDATAIEPDYLESSVKLLDKYDSLSMAYKIQEGDKFIQWGVKPGQINYAGASIVKIDWLEKINGYDEFYDGSKGYEDSDVPHRLKNMGARLGCTPGVQIIQTHYGSTKITKTACCIFQREHVIQNRWKKDKLFIANTLPLRDYELDFMNGCTRRQKDNWCPTIKQRCPYPPDPNIKLYTDKSFQFNLKQQRKELHAS